MPGAIISGGMKNESLLQKLRPYAFRRYQTLPLFGPVLEGSCLCLHNLGYRDSTLRDFLAAAAILDERLRRRGKRALAEISQRDLRETLACYSRPQDRHTRQGIEAIMRLLRENGCIAAEVAQKPSRLQTELLDFGCYLRAQRGLAPASIVGHQDRLRQFLCFLKWDHRGASYRSPSRERIDAYLRFAATTHCRASLQNVVATLRSYMRWNHARGLLRVPLHTQIASPQVYRLERLPRALPWEQVSRLLRSIDRSDPVGLRDFTVLYLAAHYGLRSGELMNLKLEDIHWRAGTLLVRQTKTKQNLALPLTDEAGDVLSRYLRAGRPTSKYRELFLSHRAPTRPLTGGSVYNIMESRAQRSGIRLQFVGGHTLRHSLAVHLLRRGVGMKTIGDTLGHRHPVSTSAYLRLAVDDLRQVGLPVPAKGQSAALVATNWKISQLVRVAPPRLATLQHAGFRSHLAPALRLYLDNNHALGRRYRNEESVLRYWDNFIYRNYPNVLQVHALMFQQWCEQLTHLKTTVRRMHMRIVRGFLLFHSRSNPSTYLPDTRFFPRPVPYQAPRLVTPSEMANILATSKHLPPSDYNPLRAETVRLGLILLFCCGLRIGELLRLRLAHIDPDERVLRIEATKFHKDRLVPLSCSVFAELRTYLTARRQYGLPMALESFLMWSGKGKAPRDGYTQTGFGYCWHELCLSAGVLAPNRRPPRLHDLRHSFCVAALHRWYLAKQNPQAKLPLLTTYIGHASVSHTYHYLHLTPALGQSASEQFHSRYGKILEMGGVA